jgi:hypothetical protein
MITHSVKYTFDKMLKEAGTMSLTNFMHFIKQFDLLNPMILKENSTKQ